VAVPDDISGAPRGRFLFDLGDPDCYLVAERILGELPVVAEWEPVLAIDLNPAWRPAPPDPARLSARVDDQGLLPLRLPAIWPPDSRMAMRTAAFARSGGKTVAFVLAAFRQAFAAGRNLGDTETVLLAAAAAELHPRAVLTGIELRSVHAALGEAADRARADGVTRLPAIVHAGRVFEGPDALDQAVAALTPAAPGR
jgi:2-hydroxychromene-2-carboxylate isomerase